jgi:hypothetical protein
MFCFAVLFSILCKCQKSPSIGSILLLSTSWCKRSSEGNCMCHTYKAYSLRARTVKPERQPLPVNDSETTFVSRQQLSNHVPRQRKRMQRWRYCLKRRFLLGPCKGVILKTVGTTESVLYGSLWSKDAVVRWSPFRDLNAQTEESPLLEAVTRERMVKTHQAGKDLACTVVICEMWRLMVALLLLVVPSCVCIGQ